MKKETKNPLLAYEQPVSKEIRMRVQGMFCQSPNGIEGAAEEEYGDY